MKISLLLLLSTLLSDSALAASFACDRAQAPDEKAICAQRDLNDKDVEMATQYRFLTGLFAMGARGALQDEQQRWLRSRRACGADTACLTQHYDQRLAQLERYYTSIDKPL